MVKNYATATDTTNHHHSSNDDELDNGDDLSLLHNNYTDYSCSTSIERLARDVETILHAWHVDDGSDRHFSTSTVSTTAVSTTTTTSSSSNSSPLLLRSHVITWNLSFYYSLPSFLVQNQNAKLSNNLYPPQFHQTPKEKVHCDITLQLDLWDSPPSVHASDQNKHDTNSDDDDTLPYSIQRQKHNTISENSDWFSNFSTMFGIGQHITLTPINPDCFFISSKSILQEPKLQSKTVVDNENDDDTAAMSMPSKYSLPTTTSTTNNKNNNNTTYQSKGATNATEEELIHPSYKPLLQYLTCIILHNHTVVVSHSVTNPYSKNKNERTVPSMILSSWLQTALNIAVSHCDCQIPIFGMWGKYSPDDSASVSSSFLGDPSWIPALLYDIPLLPEIASQYDKQQQQRNAVATSSVRSKPPTSSKHHFREADTKLLPSRPCSPLQRLTQTHISGHVWSSCSSKITSFSLATVQHLPNQLYFKWNIWGDVLQQLLVEAGTHSLSSSPLLSTVHLCQAKHIYVWKKQRPSIQSGSVIWHALSGTMNQQHNNKHMVREWRSQDLWIPPSLYSIDDPIVAESMHEYICQCQQYVMHLIEQALGRRDDDDEPIWGPNDDPIDSMIVQLDWSSQPTHPLLTLPLQSRHDMSPIDWEEMVDATESAILDPYRAQKPSLSVQYDPDVTHATLATTQRCILAAMIRTATLPRETLVSQLHDAHAIRLWDNKAGNRSATLLCKKSNVDKATRSLVDAMDWQHASVEMIERYEAETIVRHVLNGNAAYGFPSPPDNIISILAGDFVDTTCGLEVPRLCWKPLRKSAPPGRLLSLLFLQMGRVRSPSSMALVWNVFVDELRRRLDSRESIPNMNYIPGLDPPLVEKPPSDGDASSTSRSCFLSIGAKAHLAALVNSTEPDPDDMHCLIGQKLQVFNLCLEAMISSDMQQVVMFENRPHDDQEDMDGDSIDHDKPRKLSPTAAKTLINGSVVDGLPLVDDTVPMNDEPDRDDSSKSTLTQEFYDALDADLFVSPNKAAKRVGARCPIQGLYLTDSGDQMYAPYLQRPYPLTDDVIAERLLILSRQNKEPGVETVQQRLQITHHYQKPKLLSDMRSFKAANPGATYDDFTKWYGHPKESLSCLGNLLSIEITDETGNGAQDQNWIQALDVSQNFWKDTWANADAVAAFEQEPLFDAEITVEVALDFLENVHPAALMGQVVAVNLAMSYFILSTSKGETSQIPLVQNKVARLYAIIDEALQQLSSDATKLIDNVTFQNNDPEAMTSEKAMYVRSIAACTHACEMIAATEFIISRAKSLLHKLPKQYDLVEKILTKYETPTVPISQECSLMEILNTITIQQEGLVTASSEVKAKPVLRQYMLRNVNDALPCQLCVRSSDEGAKVLGPNQHSGYTVLAMTRTIEGTD